MASASTALTDGIPEYMEYVGVDSLAKVLSCREVFGILLQEQGFNGS